MSQQKYQYNPEDWQNIKEIKIPDLKNENAGLIFRVYKHVNDAIPRLGLSSYWVDFKSKEDRKSKEIRINPYQMPELVEALKECYTIIQEHSKSSD
jgi:hypothetical protein